MLLMVLKGKPHDSKDSEREESLNKLMFIIGIINKAFVAEGLTDRQLAVTFADGRWF